MLQKNCNKLFFLSFLLISLFCISCKKERASVTEQKRIIIWTSCSEFAQYVELFNSAHEDVKAVLVYKDNPALSLPPAKDELPPDIVIGSWLRSDSVNKNFKRLDYFFDNGLISSDIFYPQLLEAGKKGKVQYLFPVSFNLPIIIFSEENRSFISQNYILTPQEIKNISETYNKKNEKGFYSRMGFTPLSNEGFLYLVTRIYNTNFHLEKNQIVWNNVYLKNAADFLRDWTISSNASAQTEEDFSFKYLFMPYYRQVTSERTLFSYTTSNEFFKLANEQELDIDFRWIVQDNKIHLEDSFVMLGIGRDCRNITGATEFVSWFFTSDNQKIILERKQHEKLETGLFGIAGGFSALTDVTEHVIPLFYTALLSNLPPSNMLTVPQKLPARWESYKSLVIVPYLENYIKASDPNVSPTIEFYEKEWRKKGFD